jgi:nitroimidazol reductase NimA-like FMN-containing flavoprotein (pyridoxamine 5'-phosphate oxidase superfamily)
MAERMSDDAQPAAQAGHPQPQAPLEPFGQAESWKLISAGGVGRIGYSGRYGPTVLPVNFALSEQAVVFRTGQDSPLGEDLRTGIADADYVVAFEVDEISPATREGWSILIQGSAHHIDSEHERAQVMRSGVEAWPGGEKDLFIRIQPTRITGRRISRPGS